MYLSQVIDLVKLGFYVFPVKPFGKKPLVLWQSDATDRATQIKVWWEYYRDVEKIDPETLNWGIHCGKSGIVAIDVDNKKWTIDAKSGQPKPIDEPFNGSEELERLEFEYGPLPEDLWIDATPNDGYHYCGTGVTASGVNKLAPGIDIKSAGGFILAPWCAIEKADGSGLGVYTPVRGFDEDSDPMGSCPQWVRDMVPIKHRDPNSHIPLVEQDQEHHVTAVVDYLTHDKTPLSIKGKGGNEACYKVAARCKDLGTSKDVTVNLMLEHWYPHCVPNNNPDFVERLVGNAFDYGQNRPGSAAPEAFFDKIDISETDSQIEFQKWETSDEKDTYHPDDEKGLQIKDPWDLDNLNDTFASIAVEDIPPKIILLDPWLEIPSSTLIWGEKGAGKTWFCLGVLKSLLTGESLGPWRVFKRARRVAYIDGEMTKRDLQRRFKQMGMDNLDLAWVYCNKDMVRKNFKPGDLGDVQWRYAISRQLIKRNIDFVLFDNLSSFSTKGDENSSEAFAPIRNWMNRLTAWDISSALVHHSGKDPNSQRGTSSHEDNVDNSIRLTKQGDEFAEDTRFNIYFEKSRVDNVDKPKIRGWQCEVKQETTWDETSKKSVAFRTELVFSRPYDNQERELVKCLLHGHTQKDIASMLNMGNKSVASMTERLAMKRLIKINRNRTGKNRYDLTEKGKQVYFEDLSEMVVPEPEPPGGHDSKTILKSLGAEDAAKEKK